MACTTDAPGAVALTAKPVKMFPMVGMAVLDGTQGLLRNLVAHQIDPDQDYKALLVQCPSQINLLERSPYAASNALYRFQMSADDILSGRASYDVLDRIDLEPRVISPPVDQNSREVKSKAFLAGLTLGISVLVDELTNDDGSPLVRIGAKVFRPKGMALTGFNLRSALCAAGGDCPDSTPRFRLPPKPTAIDADLRRALLRHQTRGLLNVAEQEALAARLEMLQDYLRSGLVATVERPGVASTTSQGPGWDGNPALLFRGHDRAATTPQDGEFSYYSILRSYPPRQ